jgi:hypothetical protein
MTNDEAQKEMTEKEKNCLKAVAGLRGQIEILNEVWESVADQLLSDPGFLDEKDNSEIYDDISRLESHAKGLYWDLFGNIMYGVEGRLKRKDTEWEKKNPNWKDRIDNGK